MSSIQYEDVVAALDARDESEVVRLLDTESRWRTFDKFEAGSVFHEAAFRGLPKVLRYFVATGTDPSLVGRLNETPLHQAVEGRRIEVFDLLIELGADVDHGTGRDPTPLFLAVRAGDVDTVAALVDRGADVNACYVDHAGRQRQPLDVAELAGDGEMIALLRRRGAVAAGDGVSEPTVRRDRRWARLSTYVKRGNDRAAKTFCLEHPEMVNGEGSGGLIHMAPKAGSVDLTRFALEHGGDPDTPRGLTFRPPLVAAIRSGKLEIVRLLLAAGADPNAGKPGNPTPLFDAIFEDRADMVQLMLAHGAEVNAAFMHGAGYARSAYDLAREQGASEIENLLAEHGGRSVTTIELAERHPEQAAEFAESALQGGDPTSALAILTTVLDREPTAEAFYQRGVAHDLLGEPERSAADLSRAIDLDAEHYQAHYSRALLHWKAEHWVDAKADLEAAHAIDQYDFLVANALASLLTSCPEANLRDANRAVGLALCACETSDWEDAKCLRTLADAYEVTGDTANAESYRKQAEELPEYA